MNKQIGTLFGKLCSLRVEFVDMKKRAEHAEARVKELEETLRGSRNVRLHLQLEQAKSDVKHLFNYGDAIAAAHPREAKNWQELRDRIVSNAETVRLQYV